MIGNLSAPRKYLFIATGGLDIEDDADTQHLALNPGMFSPNKGIHFFYSVVNFIFPNQFNNGYVTMLAFSFSYHVHLLIACHLCLDMDLM